LTVNTHSTLIYEDEKSPHPGLPVKHDSLEPLSLSVTAAAKILEMSHRIESASTLLMRG
jgi:hypothetical protein